MRLRTKLYQHQEAAVKKLQPLPYGALFMDMGTGKSRTAIELADRWHVSNVLWFTPVSLKETVRQEIRKHVAYSRPYIFNHQTKMRSIPHHFWTIIGIESMSSSDRQILCAHALTNKNTLVIVDESSYIKGHRSWRTLRITDIGKKANKRLILTGTPMSQGVEDLFSQFRFLSPKILNYSSWYTFARNHLEYSEKYPGLVIRAHNTSLIADKIAPYTYQVTKDECLDLPAKMYNTKYYRMSYQQREAYEQAKYEILELSDMRKEIDSYIIFRLFTALQQITSGYWNRHGQIIDLPNPRIDILIDVANEVRGQCIIWCKYLRTLHQITAKLSNTSVLYGALSESERNEQLRQFQSGETKYLVSTLSTGGHGLNLTNATTAIFCESSFKCAERLQAEDRIHRIGQEHKTLYIDLVCRNSIDERIAQSIASKMNAVEDFRREVERVKDDSEAMAKLLENL